VLSALFRHEPAPDADYRLDEEYKSSTLRIGRSALDLVLDGQTDHHRESYIVLLQKTRLLVDEPDKLSRDYCNLYGTIRKHTLKNMPTLLDGRYLLRGETHTESVLIADDMKEGEGGRRVALKFFELPERCWTPKPHYPWPHLPAHQPWPHLPAHMPWPPIILWPHLLAHQPWPPIMACQGRESVDGEVDPTDALDHIARHGAASLWRL
jgi:hypothetical protein